MALRKYYAATVEEAFAQIQQEIGEDAVILDTRTYLEQEGPDAVPCARVEVWVQEPDGQRTPTTTPSLPTTPTVLRATASGSSEGLTDELARLHARMQSVHAQLDTVVQRLDWLGAGGATLSGELALSVADSLTQHLAFSGGIRVDGPVHIALIGPSGVGKTTLTTKLAYSLAQTQRCNVGIISADTIRVGAREQISTLCHHAGLPLEIVYRPEQVAEAVSRLSDCTALLLDTPGINPRRADECAWLEAMLTALDPSEVHLVLPASLSGPALADNLRMYARYEPDHLMLTKLDETAHLVEMLPFIAKSGLALSYLGTGPSITGELCIASPSQLTDALRVT
jgi:flagellar biosynthesis GTPase FlhF